MGDNQNNTNNGESHRPDMPKPKLSVQIFHLNEGDTIHIKLIRESSEDFFVCMVFCIPLSTWDY